MVLSNRKFHHYRGFCPFSVLLAIHGGPWLTHDKERDICVLSN